MTTRFFSLILLFFTMTATAQNLVPNHSFEEFEDGCPETPNGTTAIGWTRWTNSPDLFSTCVDPQNFNDSLGWVPWNVMGYQLSEDGDSYAGLCAHGQVGVSENYREYLGCELLEPLEVGETYYVSFKTSMAFGNVSNFIWACNRLGAYFTDQSHHFEDNPLQIPNYAHVYEENIISDTVNWVSVEGSFIADQAYTHIGIGVFFDYNLLDTLSLISGASLGSYYYIDDVCVSRFPDCLTSTDIYEDDMSDFNIYPNPAKDRVTISGTESLSGIRLFNMRGQELEQFETSQARSIELPISDLQNGTYVLEIRSKTGYKRKKIVVLR